MNTNRTILEYLSRLERAGHAAGLDAAVVHDMVVDAEVHLRDATAGGAGAESAVMEFGSVEEIVSAYASTERARGARRGHAGEWKPEEKSESSTLKTETRSEGVVGGMSGGVGAAVGGTGVLERWSRIPVFGVVFDRYAWGALVFFLVGIVPATVYFTLVVTGLSLAVGTLPLIIGVPMLVLTLGMARGLCLAHGWTVEKLLGLRMPRRVQPIGDGRSVGFWSRIGLWLKDVRSWLSLAFLVGNMPVAAALFGVFFACMLASLSVLTGPLISVIRLGRGNHVHFLWWRLEPDAVSGYVTAPFSMTVFALLIGPVLFIGTLWLAKGAGWVYGQVVKAIQVTRPAAGVAVEDRPGVVGAVGA